MEDVLELPFLNEPEIVHFLQLRFQSGIYFTLAGSVLVLVNPFTPLDASSESTQLLLDLLQNALNAAQSNFQNIQDDDDSQSAGSTVLNTVVNQSVLVGGEGGSGKSEVARLVLQCLKDLSAEGNILDNIIVANRILDSFGNARTMNCPDSSRFGKVVEVCFATADDNHDEVDDPQPRVVTARLKSFLLESSRTTTQQPRDRNFNVFYEVLAGIPASDRAHFGLKTAAEYAYTNQGGLTDPQAHDISQYRQLVSGLGRFGLAEAQPRIVGVLTGILNLGNVTISTADESAGTTLNIALHAAAEGLGITDEALEKLLTTKTLLTPRKENITLKLSPTQSLIARDAIAKAVYKKLFDWLTTELNDWFRRSYRGQLFVEDEVAFSLKIVDLFGFDSFKNNTLDQLCINFANETLQQHFVHRIFDLEMAMYETEGIQFERLSFTDNKENLAFIGTQLFPLIDDHCRLPGPSDKKLVSLMYSNFAVPLTPTATNNSIFSANRKQQLELKFSIKHFVGQVEYVANDFVEKNLESIPADTAATMRTSSNSIIAGMFPVVTVVAGTGRTAVVSVVSTFRSELAALMKEIEPTAPHFIRCIKPFQPFQTSADAWDNMFTALNGSVFQQRRVAEELKFAGVIDAVRIAKSGYRSELRYLEFYNRYRLLANEVDEEYRDPLSSLPKALPYSTVFAAQRVFCEELVKVLSFHDELQSNSAASLFRKKSGRGFGSRAASMRLNRGVSFTAVDTNLMSARDGIVAMENIQFGKSRIFMRKREFDFLEAFLTRTRMKHASIIQCVFRMRRERKHYLLSRQKVIVLQKMFRGQYVRHHFHLQTRLEKCVVRIQRQWRKRYFLRGIILIQTLCRGRRARKTIAIAKVKREQLIQFFGQYFTAREMRAQRRATQLTNSRLPSVPIIPYAERRHLPAADLHDIEASFNHEALDTAAKQLFSNPKWAARERLKKESENGNKNGIDSLQRRAEKLAQQLPVGKLKQKLLKYSKLLVHGEFLLKPEAVLEFSFIGRLLGTSSSLLSSTSNLNISEKAAANVNIQPSHDLFAYIHKVKNKLRTIETLATEEIVRFDSDGYRGNENSGAFDQVPFPELIDDLLGICTHSKLYFERFVRDFCIEYGEGSTYCRAFNSRAEYLKTLVRMIVDDKAVSKESLVARDITRLLAEQAATGEAFPLSTSWHKRFDAEEDTHHRELFGGLQDTLMLSKLNVVVVGKATLNKDNLRVIDIQDIAYQYQPVRPGQQFMVNTLIALLSGGFAPTKSLVKVMDRLPDGEVKRAFYETSNSGNADRTMMDVLYNPLAVEQVSTRSFSAMVLACVVLGLTHLQPNHMTIRLESSSSSHTTAPSFLSFKPFTNQSAVELTGICGDREAIIKFFDFENSFNYRPSERNYSALFCLPQMDEPIDVVLREFLLANDQAVEAILCCWLREVRAQNHRYEQLRHRKTEESHLLPFTTEDMDGLLLPVKVPKGMLIEVRRRLNIIRDAIRQAEDLRIASVIAFRGHSATAAADREERGRLGSLRNGDILHIFYPELAKFYELRRKDDEFTNGVLSSGAMGVRSYAFVYHKGLSDLQQGKPWEVEGGVNERPLSMYPRQPSSLPLATGRQSSMIMQQQARHQSLPSQRSLYRTNSAISKAAGANNDSFWRNIETVADPADDLKRSKSGVLDAPSASIDFVDTYATNDDDAILLGGTSLFAIDENNPDDDNEEVAFDHHDVFGPSPAMKNSERLSTSSAANSNTNKPRSKSANHALRQQLSFAAARQQQQRVRGVFSATNTNETAASKLSLLDYDQDHGGGVFAEESPLKSRPNSNTNTKQEAALAAAEEEKRRAMIRRSSSIDRLQSSRKEFMRGTSPLALDARNRRMVQTPPSTRARGALLDKKQNEEEEELEEEEEESDKITPIDRNITSDSFYDLPSNKQSQSQQNMMQRQAFSVSIMSGRSASFLYTTSPVASRNNATPGGDVGGGAIRSGNSRSSRLPSPNPISSPSSLLRRNSSVMNNVNNHISLASSASSPEQRERFASPTGRLSQVLIDIEDEALTFLRNIDFLALDIDSLKLRNPDLDYLDILGTSLAFLPTWILRNVNEKQLLSMTKHWLRYLKPLSNVGGKGQLQIGNNPLAARLRFCVTDLQLHYDRTEDMLVLSSKPVLALLEQRMNVHIRFFYPERVSLSSPSAASNGRIGSRTASSFFNHSQANIDRIELREAGYKMPAQLQNFDLTQTALQPIAADIAEIPPADEELHVRLMETLRTCANLLHGQTIAEARPKVQLVKLIIEALCLQHENHHSDQSRLHSHHRYHPLRLGGDLVRAFVTLLLAYPALAPIGEAAAERSLFATIAPDLVNEAVMHPLRPRYMKLITILLDIQPELLYMRDSKRRYLPCDALRVAPHTATNATRDPLHPQRQQHHGMISPIVFAACGLDMLTLFVNTAAQRLARRLFEQCRSFARQERSLFSEVPTAMTLNAATPDHPSLHHGRPDRKTRHLGIFSSYRGEEELIVCAAHFLFPVTATELQQRRFDFFKRDAGSGQRLLLAQLVLVDAGGPIDQYLGFAYDQDAEAEADFDDEQEIPKKLILEDEWLGLANLLSTADRSSLRPLVKHTLGLLINALQQRVATGELTMEDAEFFLTGPALAGVDEDQIRMSQVAQQVQREWAIGNHLSRVEIATSMANQLPRLVDHKAYELDPQRLAKHYPSSEASSPRTISPDDPAFASVEAMASEWAARLAELQQLQLVVTGAAAAAAEKKKKKNSKKSDKKLKEASDIDGSVRKKKKSKAKTLDADDTKPTMTASAFFSFADTEDVEPESKEEKPKKAKKNVNYNLGTTTDFGDEFGEESKDKRKKKKKKDTEKEKSNKSKKDRKSDGGGGVGVDGDTNTGDDFRL